MLPPSCSCRCTCETTPILRSFLESCVVSSLRSFVVSLVLEGVTLRPTCTSRALTDSNSVYPGSLIRQAVNRYAVHSLLARACSEQTGDTCAQVPSWASFCPCHVRQVPQCSSVFEQCHNHCPASESKVWTGHKVGRVAQRRGFGGLDRGRGDV